MNRPTLIDLNPVNFNYYPFMISPDKCNGSCNNAVDDLSAKVCVPSKTKDVTVKVINIIKRINEAKTLVKHLSCNCQCKFESTACNSNQCQCECKNYQMCICTCFVSMVMCGKNFYVF